MNTKDLTNLIMKHDSAISQLERDSSQTMLLWRIVGAVALVALGVYLNGAAS